MGKVLRRGLLVTAALFCVVVFGWLPYWFGGLATKNRFKYKDTENAGLTPGSFNLAFEDVSLQTSDGMTLKGWWVPASEDRGTVILVHGLNRSRIEMVKKVPFVHRVGWHALLFDVRHHGESGGDVSSFGYFERQDVASAIAAARSRSKGPVVLWGVSLGAATVTLAAAEDQAVAGVVCDSSYRSLRDTVRHHLVLFRSFAWWLRAVPSWPVGSEVVYWIGRRGGFDPDAVDVVAAAHRLAGRPCLFVCNSGDRRMPPEIAHELQAAAGNSARLLVVPGNSHGGAYREGTAAYETAVGEVLSAALAAPSRAAASLTRPNAGE
jgi:pimeloyl-ACP methyl ester carboxylesterase